MLRKSSACTKGTEDRYVLTDQALAAIGRTIEKKKQ